MWTEFWARPTQLEPEENYFIWLCLAGRGWGKTRVGAEYIRFRVENGTAKNIALVARSPAEARDVMVLGPSGIIKCSPPWYKPIYSPSNRSLTWPCRCCDSYECSECPKALIFSSHDPDKLRGPQYDLAWADELCAWKYLEKTWDNLLFGLRLGQNPKCIVTTTPRPQKLIRELYDKAIEKSYVIDPVTEEPTSIREVVMSTGSTLENRSNLAATFIGKIINDYSGTRIGRQEIEGEILGDVEGALFRREDIEDNRIEVDELYPNKGLSHKGKLFKFIEDEIQTICIAIDPSMSDGENAAETGIIVCGVDHKGHGYVLLDASGTYSPNEWGEKAVKLFNEFCADCIIVEKNQGGSMIKENITIINANLPIYEVWASKGKLTRAEPISTLYERGKVHHFGKEERFKDLEYQLINWVPGQKKSPDRLDAMVWGMTYLLIDCGGDIASGMVEPSEEEETLSNYSGFFGDQSEGFFNTYEEDNSFTGFFGL